MEKKYINHVNIKPVLMYREDIVELYNLIETQPGEEKSVEIEYMDKEKSIKITNIGSLDSVLDFPPTNYMTFTVRVWKEHEIVSGLSVSFNRNNITYQLRSENEIWFLGIDSKLKIFFKAKRPWYSLIQVFSPYVFPVAMLLSFQHSYDLLRANDNTVGIFWLFVTITILMITILIFFQKIFPYVWISLSSKSDRKFSYEKWTFIVAILALIVTAVSGLVLPLITN